jgi:hypothetical protein
VQNASRRKKWQYPGESDIMVSITIKERGGGNDAGNRFLISGEAVAGSGWKNKEFFRSDRSERPGPLCVFEGQYLGLNH